MKTANKELEHKVAKAIMILFFVFLVGTVSYRFLEGWSWIDCFYTVGMTITTLGAFTTPVTDAGKLFAVFFALVSIGMSIYVLATIGEAALEKRLSLFVELPRKKLREQFDKMTGRTNGNEKPRTKINKQP